MISVDPRDGGQLNGAENAPVHLELVAGLVPGHASMCVRDKPGEGGGGRVEGYLLLAFVIYHWPNTPPFQDGAPVVPLVLPTESLLTFGSPVRQGEGGG